MTNKTTEDGKEERYVQKKKLKDQVKKTYLNQRNFRRSKRRKLSRKYLKKMFRRRGIHQYLA